MQENHRFVLFTNTRKEKENHPDYNGEITYADGSKQRMAGWVRKDKNGNDYVSGEISDDNLSDKKNS